MSIDTRPRMLLAALVMIGGGLAAVELQALEPPQETGVTWVSPPNGVDVPKNVKPMFAISGPGYGPTDLDEPPDISVEVYVDNASAVPDTIVSSTALYSFRYEVTPPALELGSLLGLIAGQELDLYGWGEWTVTAEDDVLPPTVAVSLAARFDASCQQDLEPRKKFIVDATLVADDDHGVTWLQLETGPSTDPQSLTRVRDWRDPTSAASFVESVPVSESTWCARAAARDWAGLVAVGPVVCVDLIAPSGDEQEAILAADPDCTEPDEDDPDGDVVRAEVPDPSDSSTSEGDELPGGGCGCVVLGEPPVAAGLSMLLVVVIAGASGRRRRRESPAPR